MTASVLVVVSVLAFTALALSMDRHARDVFGTAPSTARRWAMRATGWVLLGAALVLGMLGWGKSVGAVEWTAALSAAAVPLVFLVLPRFAARGEAKPRRMPDPAATVETPAARSVPARLWRALCMSGLVALPMLMAWALMQ